MDTERKERFEGGEDPTFGEVEKFYRTNFNTDLSPDEEFRFHGWADEQDAKTGRNVLDDLTDYDMRGAFKEGMSAGGEDAHWPDKFKKPNHPTFSTESIYHGANDPQHGGTYEGGEWGQTTDGKYSFKPSRKMLETTHPETWLKGYMRDCEPDVVLILPEKTGQEER